MKDRAARQSHPRPSAARGASGRRWEGGTSRRGRRRFPWGHWRFVGGRRTGDVDDRGRVGSDREPPWNNLDSSRSAGFFHFVFTERDVIPSLIQGDHFGSVLATHCESHVSKEGGPGCIVDQDHDDPFDLLRHWLRFRYFAILLGTFAVCPWGDDFSSLLTFRRGRPGWGSFRGVPRGRGCSRLRLRLCNGVLLEGFFPVVFLSWHHEIKRGK